MTAAAATAMEQCVCGHSQGEHIRARGCRVAGCPCDRFRPIPEIDGLRRELRVARAHG